MLKKIFLIALFSILAFSVQAQAGPGHEVPAPPEKKINKKQVRQDIKRAERTLRSAMKASSALWSNDNIQADWQADKACLKETYDLLDPDAPLTDIQTLYTLSSLRALGLHSFGPDGKTHASFRSTRESLFAAARKSKTKKIRAFLQAKGSDMSILSLLPRYQKGLCPLLERWDSAGRPDLASWAKLYRYSDVINYLSGNSYDTSVDIYELFYAAFPPKKMEDYEKLSKRIGWLVESVPYRQGHKSSVATWKKWLGEDGYPDPGYGY